MQQTQHTHWAVIAYDELDDKKRYINPVEINIVDALNEQWAIEQAKTFVIRDNYVLRKMWTCKACLIQEKAEKLIDKQSKFLDSE